MISYALYNSKMSSEYNYRTFFPSSITAFDSGMEERNFYLLSRVRTGRWQILRISQIIVDHFIKRNGASERAITK